jgi:hypothetical protein
MLTDVPSRAGRLALMREVRRVLVPGGLATFSVHDDARTRPSHAAGEVLVADSPEPGDFLVHDPRENAVRYRHLFHREELAELVGDAGFTDAVIGHTSDFGETWDNVFVVVCR